MPLVGSLIVGSPKRQIVRVLNVRFSEHQQRNVNLQKRRSGGDRSAASMMIKLAESTKREKRIGVVRIAYLPIWGIFPTYRVKFTKSHLSILG